MAALGVAFAISAAPAGAETRCPATFQVLHNDHVGTMSLPAGTYAITVNGLSCASASSLLTQFLQDFDGKLPGGWRTIPAQRRFQRGSSSVWFFLTPTGRPRTPQRATPSRPVTCPATFSVLNNDRIGSVSFPKGAYRTTLTGGVISCQTASRLFASFLTDVDGKLPGGWSVRALPGSARGGRFSGPSGMSFEQQLTTSSTSGGGVSPSGSVSCGPFRVEHNDRIGSLSLPRGLYTVFTLSRDTLSCSQATQQFATFLDRGSVTSPWVLDASTGTFTRGRGSNTGFRVKPLSP